MYEKDSKFSVYQKWAVVKTAFPCGQIRNWRKPGKFTGGRLYNSLPQMCGLKLEGNGFLLGMEGGKRCPPIWVYV